MEDEVYKIYPAAILARRLVPRNNIGVPQVLIQWSHSSPNQATCEDYYSVAAKFPGFDSWDKDQEKEGEMSCLQEKHAFKWCPIEGKAKIGGKLESDIESDVVLNKHEELKIMRKIKGFNPQLSPN
ncbi:UNVERIFIED_CONTAM: hypothetical protein Sindi_1320700 [Sesamum indicum]